MTDMAARSELDVCILAIQTHFLALLVIDAPTAARMLMIIMIMMTVMLMKIIIIFGNEIMRMKMLHYTERKAKSKRML